MIRTAWFALICAGAVVLCADRAASAQPDAATGTSKNIVLFGGTRGTGLEIAKRLRADGHRVTVAVRASSETDELEKLGVRTVVADALERRTIDLALSGQHFDAAISTVGTSRGDKANRPDYLGNRNIIDAVAAAGIKRMVLITVIGAGDSAGSEPTLARYFLKEVIELKTKAEDHLRTTSLDYTIIRPGGLGNGPAGRSAVLIEDPQAFSYITRADLARLTVAALFDPATYRKTLTAYDAERQHIWSIWTD
ncbi:MAG: SDR family oxidoreductase [Steroidobacteraceae bacterium]